MDTIRETLPVLCGLPAGAKPKTDEEIYAMAHKEWMDILCSLWIAIGKPVDMPRLKIYSQAFADVPYGLLERAVKRVQLTTTYQVVPTIAEIHKALQVELREANCTNYADWTYQVWARH